MTPRELTAYALARRDALESERRRAAQTIYDQALLIRAAVWAKEVPSFEAVFPESRGAAAETDDDRLYAAVCAFNARMGGGEE